MPIFPLQRDNEAIRVDDTTTANITYVGYAVVGSSESDDVWKIFIVDETTNTAIKWAGSNDDYVHVWDDRASLSYG